MDPVRTRRVQALYDAAARLHVDEVAAYLAQACAGDPGLAAEVRALIAAQASTAPMTGRAGTPDADPSARPPLRVEPRYGAWQVIGHLGSGGMGSVHMAERVDGAYQARAALKLLNPWLLDPDYVQRFVRERQILAQLAHPGIARLLDGGVSAQGVPWLAMEYIDGLGIGAWAGRHNASLRERVAMVLKVCDAVQFAHQNLVIHRDIKPGNILVDVQGQPHLLDFGIAKVIGPAGAENAATATRLLTPEYASPEQLRGDPVSTASDVYSLGVVLYELLAGERPPPRSGVAGDPVVTRPSTRVARTIRGHADDVEARRWLRRLRGDLDTVVLKALATDPARRYATVRDFASDLGNVLASRPVQARPDAFAYRLRLFMRRNRAAVAATLAFVALLAASAIGLALLSMRLARERDVAAAARGAAEQEKQTAERVAGFALDLLSGANPQIARGALPTLRDVLDRGVVQVRGQLADQPAVQARLMGVMAEAYRQLGEFEAGLALARDALAIRESRLPDDLVGLSDGLDGLGELQRESGAYVVAEASHRRAMALREALHPPVPLKVAQSLNNLALVLQEDGRWTEALPLQRRSYDMRSALSGPDAHPTIAALVNLGILERQLGDLDAAERDFGTALERRLRVLGPEHVSSANVQTNLARVLAVRGRYDEAEKLERAALATRRRILGDDSPIVSGSLHSLGAVLWSAGRVAEAESVLRESLAIDARVLPLDQPDRATTMVTLGGLLNDDGRAAEAEPLLREALAVRRAALAPNHAWIAYTALRLADALLVQGRVDETGPLLQQAQSIQDAALPPEHADRGLLLLVQARRDAALGRADEARAGALRACEAMRRNASTLAPDLRSCDRTLALLVPG